MIAVRSGVVAPEKFVEFKEKVVQCVMKQAQKPEHYAIGLMAVAGGDLLRLCFLNEKKPTVVADLLLRTARQLRKGQCQAK